MTGSGTAYLFGATAGHLLRIFSDPHPAVFNNFGSSVSISGNKILIGSPFNATSAMTESGAAYLFSATTGHLLQSFSEPHPTAFNYFGSFVSISGNNILIGSPSNNTSGKTSSGAAYLFSATTGHLLQSFSEPHPGAFNRFGNSVSISGNNILIGSPANATSGKTSSGAAYLFSAATGHLLQSFSDPHPANYNNFGSSVSISGNNMLIDSPYNATSGKKDSGAVYLYNATTGHLLQSFSEPHPAIDNYFGSFPSISGNNILIDSSNNDTSGKKQSGAAYLYNATTGHLLQSFSEPRPATGNHFGWSVSLSGNNILIGSPFKTTSGQKQAGAAYLFKPTP